MAEKPTNAIPASWRFILAIWIAIWIFFLLWPFVKNPNGLAETFSLIRADAEARRAMVYGKAFDAFLRFCNDRLPAGSTFRLVGVDYASIDKVRAFYFLYPHTVDEKAEFVLVYQTPGYREENTSTYALLNPNSFILRITQPATP